MIALIAAMAKNRVIGNKGTIPWRLPADLKRFAKLTRGHTVIMGRKTLESIGHYLPGRHNIIITRQANYQARGCTTVGSIEDALAIAQMTPAEKTFVIGGANIYTLALPYADKILLTVIDKNFGGDAFFPEFDDKEWQLQERVSHAADEHNPHSFEFRTYTRRTAL